MITFLLPWRCILCN